MSADDQIVDPLEALAGGRGDEAPALAAVVTDEDPSAAQRETRCPNLLAKEPFAGPGVDGVRIRGVERESVDRKIRHLVADRTPAFAAVGRLPDPARDAGRVHPLGLSRIDQHHPGPAADVAGTERLPGVESRGAGGGGEVAGVRAQQLLAPSRVAGHPLHVGPGASVLESWIDGRHASESLLVEERVGGVGLIVGCRDGATELLTDRFGQWAPCAAVGGSVEAECADQQRRGAERPCESPHSSVSSDSSMQGARLTVAASLRELRSSGAKVLSARSAGIRSITVTGYVVRRGQ